MSAVAAATAPASRAAVREYEARDFSRLHGTPGFSRELLDNHFTLYQGYVKATNELLHALAEKREQGDLEGAAAAELRRRLGWEWNGMRLHELYFENLGGSGPRERDAKAARLAPLVKASFGGWDAWEKELRAVGAMRGIGWAVLYEDPAGGSAGPRLLNAWINEHDVGHPAGARPLLVLDVFEHAYMLDYGTKRDEYLDAFFAAIDWSIVEARHLS